MNVQRKNESGLLRNVGIELLPKLHAPLSDRIHFPQLLFSVPWGLPKRIWKKTKIIRELNTLRQMKPANTYLKNNVCIKSTI